MTTIKVKLRPSTVPGKAGTIVYRLIHQRQVCYVTSGVHVLPCHWDAVCGMLASDASPVLRQYIACGMERFSHIIHTLELSGKPYSVHDVVARYHAGFRSCLFTDFMQAEVCRLVKEGKPGTAHNYRSTLRSFTLFLSGYPLSLESFTGEVAEAYEKWLYAKGTSPNSTSFYMRMLRAVYNKAVKRRLVEQHSPFRNVYTGVAATRKRAVPAEVVARLATLHLPVGTPLSLARDLFVFSYCTRGMAFVDIAYLQREHICGDELRYSRRKTGQQLRVRLEKTALDIVHRYLSSSHFDTPYVFPILKDMDDEKAYRQYRTALRYYNKQLKRLSAMLGLSVGLTSYTARHSWATAAYKHRVPLSVISAGMGHTSEKTTRIYLATLENPDVDDANRVLVEELGSILSSQERVHSNGKGSKRI